MNYLLRPRIWPPFQASSGVPSAALRTSSPCDVRLSVRLGPNTLRLPGGTPIFAVSRQQFMKYPD
ncbi:MAG: hypothetical protein P8X67_12335 [Syntrophobacterales bacterium]